MTVIKIPSAEELDARLSSVHQLLTARKWERAAIVYAHTEVSTDHRPVAPPKLTIKDFAAREFAGLSSRSSVHRYRDAWIHAINQGWAVPVAPGEQVTLPDQPFPAWPKFGRYEQGEIPGPAAESGGDREDPEFGEPSVRGGRMSHETAGYHRRSPEERLFHHLETAINSLRKVSLSATQLSLPIYRREQVLMKIGQVERWTQETLAIMQPVPDRPDSEWDDETA